jgi:hypothetical protein
LANPQVAAMMAQVKIYFTTQVCGAIAQLGERIVRNDEVVGSIPTSSTKTSSKQFRERPKARVNAGCFYVYRPIGAEAVKG